MLSTEAGSQLLVCLGEVLHEQSGVFATFGTSDFDYTLHTVLLETYGYLVVGPTGFEPVTFGL